MPTELRVHGVSGTPPGDMLYTAPVTYDQGWDLAKVFETHRDPWDVKAFHWGSLTSKSSLSAFWILLAPFAMANVAGWMTESPNVWSRIWIRVAGLSLTGIFFAQAANMTLDIPLAAGLAPTAVKWVFTLTCLGLVFGLGWLSTQSSFKPLGFGERMRHLFAPTLMAMNPLLKEPSWDDPAGFGGVVGTQMWGVHSIVHRLRRIHLTFGMTMLALVVARLRSEALVEVSALVLAGTMLVILAFTTGPWASNRIVLAVTAAAPVAGLILLAGSLVTFGWLTPLASQTLTISDELTYQMALVLGIAAGAGLLGELLASRFRRGWVALGLLSVATLLGGTLGLTGAMLVETYLTESRTTAHTFDGGATFVTIGMTGMVVVIVLALLAAMWLPGRTTGPALRRGILRSRSVLIVAGAYGLLVGAAGTMLSCNGPADGCSQANIVMPDGVAEDPTNTTVLFGLPFDPSSILGWAKILMVAIPAVLIVRSVVGGLLNGQDSRRKVGILWDLGSFWPRWFHPLGPPAYGPYAVTRTQTVLAELKPDVLAAHSQGSLIAAVALCLEDDDTLPGLFVTYGSQLGDLYPTLFPALDLDALAGTVDTQMEGRWINLWRSSDAIGGQVVEGLGTRNWEVTTGSGHSLYELTPEYCAARKTCFSGDLERPADLDLANCWDE